MALHGPSSGAFQDLISFLISLPLDVSLIGFGDVLTALCLPSSKQLTFDKHFDQNRNVKMWHANV